MVMAHVPGNHVAIDKIEERCLISGDVQGSSTNRNPDISGFGPFYADRKKDGSTAGSTDAIVTGLRTKISLYLVTDHQVLAPVLSALFPVANATP
jgi:hypothetical protein